MPVIAVLKTQQPCGYFNSKAGGVLPEMDNMDGMGEEPMQPSIGHSRKPRVSPWAIVGIALPGLRNTGSTVFLYLAGRLEHSP